jgi:diacylglycerol kinase family enzyme
VTVFSGGSGNDFVKIFSDPAAFFDLERLLDAEEAAFDMIRCNEDLALNICSVGLDARIAADVSRYKRLPLLQGFRAYALSAALNVLKGIAEHYVVEIDGERFDAEHTFVCVCSGRFYGGGFNPIPEADPSDGLLDVLVVKKVSLLQVPGLIGKYKNGRYKEISHVAQYRKTDSVRILCDKPSAVNLDGEIRMAQAVEMKVAREKIRFFYPRGLSWRAGTPAPAQGAK